MVTTIAVLGGVALTSGWDQADQIASVVGAIVGTAGLAAAVYGFATPTAAPEPPQQGGSTRVQNTNSGITYGDNIQLGDVHGTFIIGSAPQSPSPQRDAPEA